MKKMLALLLAILLLAAFSLFASAKTYFLLDDWTITGEKNEPWEVGSYIGEAPDVTVITTYGSIEFTTIGDHAFANNTVVKNVIIPDPFEKIGDYVFLNAELLESVTVTASMKTIGVGAFSGTSALRSLNLEDSSITVVNSYTFLNSGIEEIALPDTCTRIASNAFLQCLGLKKISIPASVTEIGDDAFRSSENVVICAPYGSYAIDYAIAHGIDYIYSDLEAYTFKIGDADGDGDITIMDATRVQRVLAKFDDDADGMISLRAAMDDDKVLGIMDATRIQRMLANFDDPYHIGESMTVYLSPDGKVIDAAVDSAKSE